MTTSFDTKRISINTQFKGNAKPTQTSWKLLKDSERMTFDELMPLLSKTRKPVDKACICISAIHKAKTEYQIAELALRISKLEQPSKIINIIDTDDSPNRRVGQIVASVATRLFLTRINAGTSRKAVEDTTEEPSEEDQLRVEIRSMR
jgi:hypothetical protein